MKRFISLCLMLAVCLGVYAAPGDVAGNIYYTDIKAYIFEAPITSYNIGGKTVIDAEILNWYYGFDVYWHEDTRRLEISDKGYRMMSFQAMSGELVESADGITGEVYGNYYETDIITTLNGSEIESYNIGGRTFIVAEAMRDFGYIVDWNEELRTLTIIKRMDLYKTETEYGIIKSMDRPETVKKHGTYKRGMLVTDGEIPTKSNQTFHGTGITDNYIRLSDLAYILNADVKLVENTHKSETQLVNGVSYQQEYYEYYIDFNYDTAIVPEVVPTKEEYEFEMCEEIASVHSVGLVVNGEDIGIVNFNPKSQQDYRTNIRVINKEILIPMYTAAKILGYSYIN